MPDPGRDPHECMTAAHSRGIVLATQPVYDGERHDALYRLAAGVPSGTPDPGAAT